MVLSQLVEYGAVVTSAPTFVPSTANCTPATPTLSEADAERATLPLTVAVFAGVVRLTVGGVVSLLAAVVKVASGESARLFEASADFTWKW